MKKKIKTGKRRGIFEDGRKQKLQATKPLDLSLVRSVGDLVKGMKHTSFGSRSVGEAADVLFDMTRDRNCYKILTISGAMTVAKMGLVACDMIDNGMVDAVISTGAIVTHGFVEATGRAHFKVERGMDDNQLYHAGYNRVYDTLELEKNLNDIELIVREVLFGIDRETVLSSRIITAELGRYLSENINDRNILKCAHEKKVPIYIPAFTDSEIGLDVGLFNRIARKKGEKPFSFDPFLDLEEFTSIIEKQKTLGIFTIGGGVPRNWAQQVCPYLDIIANRLNEKTPFKRYQYGVRICPEPAHWGGLSGCTYQEGISWGKFAPPEEGGRWSEVYSDATIAWPLIVKAVLERLK